MHIDLCLRCVSLNLVVPDYFEIEILSYQVLLFENVPGQGE